MERTLLKTLQSNEIGAKHEISAVFYLVFICAEELDFWKLVISLLSKTENPP